MISYRHVGLSKSLASTPSTVLPFTNSGREMSDRFTDSDVSKLPLMVVVILFVFDMFGVAPGADTYFVSSFRYFRYLINILEDGLTVFLRCI